MQPQANREAVFIALLVAVLAALFVEVRWIRVALVLAPLAFVARSAVAAAPRARRRPQPAPGEERRSDDAIRMHIHQLLDLIREFYSTCHMAAVGQLSPSQAKSKAREVEDKVNAMMKEMLERIDEMEGGEEP